MSIDEILTRIRHRSGWQLKLFTIHDSRYFQDKPSSYAVPYEDENPLIDMPWHVVIINNERERAQWIAAPTKEWKGDGARGIW